MKDLNFNVPYFNSQFKFYFNGKVINAEQFGNILFGFAGNAGGFSLLELRTGGSIYSKIDTGEFDGNDDKYYVELGYNMYEKVKRDYYYIHANYDSSLP